MCFKSYFNLVCIKFIVNFITNRKMLFYEGTTWDARRCLTATSKEVGQLLFLLSQLFCCILLTLFQLMVYKQWQITAGNEDPQT